MDIEPGRQMSPPETVSPGITLPSPSFDLMGSEGLVSAALADGQSLEALHDDSRHEGLRVPLEDVNVAKSVCDSLRMSEKFGVSNLGPTSATTTATRGNKEVSVFPSQSTSENSNDYKFLHQFRSQSVQSSHSVGVQHNVDSHSLLRLPLNDTEHSSDRRFALSERSPPRRIENTTASSVLQARLETLGTSRNHSQEASATGSLNTLSTPKQNNTSLAIDTSSANYLPRSAMGYSSAEHPSNPWSAQEASVKMDRESRYSERKEHESDGHSAASTATATTASPSLNPLPTERMIEQELGSIGARVSLSAFGTPSTVSTVTSTDDASVDGLIDPPNFDRLSLKIDDAPMSMISPRTPVYRMTAEQARHRRSLSWEDGQGSYHGASHIAGQNQWAQRSPVTSPSAGPSQHTRHLDAWNGGPGQARVASFRGDQQLMDQIGHGQYGYPQVPHTDAWRQQQRYAESQQQYYLSQQMTHLPPSGQYHHTRKGSNGPPMTPPRNRQNRSVQQRQSSQSVIQGASSLPRSSSEVLKTLLRKKACLYEPDTSKAVALVTWLVGRELALEHGYFSRQQLQSGVHACVANKIDSGTITRTKVNRCMQIILNSCFHYIIPRPDGSEENGDAFRVRFAGTTHDDHGLLATLNAPWNNVVVGRDAVLQASMVEEEDKFRPSSQSPQHSPRLASSEAPNTGQEADGDHPSKRAVLLCFNENVRSAEDVFHCHNEFIRDTANASKLQLTANEWRSFFGKDSGSPSSLTSSVSETKDFLGMMKETELVTFRTSWCSKRYDHDHELCGFAHVEISRGWLRRNPSAHRYRAEICPDVVSIRDKQTGATRFIVNQCKDGLSCKMAHSLEEILYHPSLYKRKVCNASSHVHGCALGDVCPNLHPHDSQHNIKKPSNEYRGASHNRHPNSRHQHVSGNTTGSAQGRGVVGVSPRGAPMLYVSPAPFSGFERHLQMPGLQNLFRRHSSVVRAQLETPVQRCDYSNFGDDSGIGGAGRDSPTQAILKQLPSPTRE